MKVTGGIIVSFLRHWNSHIPDPRTVGRNNRLRMTCLHHYDQILIDHGISRINDVSEIMNEPEANCIATKRMFGFLLEGEASEGFSFDALQQPIIYPILLRLNHKIQSPSSLGLETAVVRVLRGMIPLNMPWIVAHTLSKKELMLICTSGSMSACEGLLEALTTAVMSEKKQIAMFDLVVAWPSLTISLNDYILATKENHGQPLRQIQGLRLVGICKGDADNDHYCLTQVRPGIADDVGAGHLTPLVGADNEREMFFPALSPWRLLNSIKTLRENCGSPKSSCCSVYLVRSKPPLNRQNRFWPDAGKQPRMMVHEPEKQNGPLSMKIVKNVAGSLFIGYHLESIRNELLLLLNNPLMTEEFEDLRPLTKAFAEIVREYESHEEHDQVANAKLRGYAQQLANYLDFALHERMREDVCAQSHHIQSAPFSASGYSRISSVGRYVVRRMLKNFGIDWDGVCVNGYVPEYKEHGKYDIVNSVLSATLEPFFHYGLAHEAGHIVWKKRRLAASIPDIERIKEDLLRENADFPVEQYLKKFALFVPEFFADCFCLVYGFNNKIEHYLETWFEFIVNLLEYNDQNSVFKDGRGDAKRNQTHSRMEMWALRLKFVSYFYHLNHGRDEPLELIRFATQQVHDTIQRVIKAKFTERPSQIASEIGVLVESNLKTISAIMKNPVGGDEKKRETIEFFQAFKRAVDLINARFVDLHVATPDESIINARSAQILQGEILDDAVDDPFPLMLFHVLKNNSGIIPNFSAILTIAALEERSVFNSRQSATFQANHTSKGCEQNDQ